MHFEWNLKTPQLDCIARQTFRSQKRVSGLNYSVSKSQCFRWHLSCLCILWACIPNIREGNLAHFCDCTGAEIAKSLETTSFVARLPVGEGREIILTTTWRHDLYGIVVWKNLHFRSANSHFQAHHDTAWHTRSNVMWKRSLFSLERELIE